MKEKQGNSKEEWKRKKMGERRKDERKGKRYSQNNGGMEEERLRWEME